MATAVAAQLALFAGGAAAGTTPLWQVEVAKIPTAEYTRDARVYVSEATEAVRPYVGDGLGDSRINPVLADVESRYFDGARLDGVTNGETAFDNLKHLESFLKSRLTGASPPNGEAERAHVQALVETLSGVRLLADAAIQDAEATISPFRASPPPAPAPAGLTEAFADLEAAKVNLAKADVMLRKANPVPATIQAAEAWRTGFNVLTRLGITYEGDHDNDGVVDVVELRFGASPLLVDSDGDGLTDKFEITELAGWTMPGRADTDGDGVPDGTEDIDGDGLTNLREQELGTSPTEADTDGDGLTDGAEIAQGRDPLVADNPPPPVSGPTPPVQTTPTDTDTDGDGLLDTTEVDDTETDPANPDSDADGLSDLAEISDHFTDPLAADTDGDGITDAYEIAHAEDQGLDPRVSDERVSKWTYVTEFVTGLIAGDFMPRDSMAWLSGYLCSGGLSLIPVVGWVLGGLADLRDTVAGLINQDWVGAGLSILGIVPYAGDAVAIPGKAAKFVARFVHRLDKVILFVARYDKISDTVKINTIKAVMVGRYGRFTDAGFSDAVVLRMAASKNNSLNRIADALTSAVAGAPSVPWIRGWKNGEKYLVEEILKGRTGKVGNKGTFKTGDIPYPNAAREPDFLEDGPPVRLHEVKTGTPHPGKNPPPKYLKQCQQDRWALDNGKAEEVLWHFLPNADGTHDIPQDLLNCLRDKQIPFKIYPANGSFYG